MSEASNNRYELIRGIQTISHFWDLSATADSITAVKSGKADDMARAKMMVRLSEDRAKMAEEIIQLVHKYWICT